MSGARSRLTLVPFETMALGLSSLLLLGLLGAGIAAAQPASSAESAWWPLPRDATDATEAPLTDPLERRGRDVFHQRCAACHGEIPEQIVGPAFLPPMPGTQALAARYQGAVPAPLEKRTNLTPELVRTVVRDGLRSMPFFRPTELSGDDLEAVAAYLTRTRDPATEE